MPAKGLMITTSAGVRTFIPEGNVLSISANANRQITAVSYYNATTAPTTAAVSVWDATGTKYEYGVLNNEGVMHALFSNLRNG
jgi:hypothetical protein